MATVKAVRFSGYSQLLTFPKTLLGDIPQSHGCWLLTQSPNLAKHTIRTEHLYPRSETLISPGLDLEHVAALDLNAKALNILKP